MLSRFKKLALKHKYLLAMAVLAATLRFLRISDTPPALNWDEVSHGYNAYSILTTGKDEWGNLFPVIFRAYGDYKLPIYIYLTSISEFFFGLSTFAVRLPSVLAGISTVVFTYLLVWEFRKDGNLKEARIRLWALTSALLVTIEPWSLFLSRGAFEANLALAFIITGVYFFLRGLKKPVYHLPSAVFLGLSIWTYNSARVFVPLFLAFLTVFYRRKMGEIYKKRKSATLYSIFIILIFFLPMFYQLTNPVGRARYGKVAILDEGAINKIIEGRNSSDLSPFAARVVHNRGTYFIKSLGKNYISHFSPKYLFFEGGSQYQFSVPGHGLLYKINLAFFYLGLALLFVKLLNPTRGEVNGRRVWQLILGWLLLAPIPSSLTREAPHVLRSITMLPVPMIITAFSFVSTADYLKHKLRINNQKLVIAIYSLMVFSSLENYLNIYFSSYRDNFSWSWQYGYKQAVQYAKGHYKNYDKIIITKKYGEPHEFFLFYGGVEDPAPWPWEPKEYQREANLIHFEQSGWFWVDRFDKFYFVNDWQINEKGTDEYTFNLESGKNVSCLEKSVSCLLITSPGNVPDGWSQLETINFLNQKPALEIYEN